MREPCPCCQGTNVHTVEQHSVEGAPLTYQVRCLDCDCRGPKALTPEVARESWRALAERKKP